MKHLGGGPSRARLTCSRDDGQLGLHQSHLRRVGWWSRKQKLLLSVSYVITLVYYCSLVLSKVLLSSSSKCPSVIKVVSDGAVVSMLSDWTLIPEEPVNEEIIRCYYSREAFINGLSVDLRYRLSRTHVSMVMDGCGCVLQAILMSHDRAISRPPPRAEPSMAAMVGMGRLPEQVRENLSSSRARGSCPLVDTLVDWWDQTG